jgi:hypothetical protein
MQPRGQGRVLLGEISVDRAQCAPFPPGQWHGESRYRPSPDSHPCSLLWKFCSSHTCADRRQPLIFTTQNCSSDRNGAMQCRLTEESSGLRSP